MKKTLIALFALTSGAMGITLDEATLSFTSTDSVPATYVTTAGGGSEGSLDIKGNNGFTVAVTLNTNTLKTYLTSDTTQHMIVGHKGSGGNGDYTTGIISNGSGTYAGGLTGSWGDTMAYDNTTVVAGLADVTWDNVTEAALTYVFNGNNTAGDVLKGTSVCLTLVDANDNILYSQSGNLSGLVSAGNNYKELYFDTAIVTSAYVYNSAIGTADAQALTQMLIVPEPTTATLSLLALAGLAARRRRK